MTTRVVDGHWASTSTTWRTNVKLTAAEYERGIVSWTPDALIEVRVQLPAAEDGSPSWSVALPDPAGSLVPAEFDPGRRIEISGAGNSDALPVVIDKPFEVRWEYQEGGRVKAKILRGPDPKARGGVSSSRLNDIPRFGRFFRLAVYTPHLSWTEDTVFWTDNLLVRFTDTIVGHQMRRFHQQAQDGQDFLAFEHRSGGFTGRFIEIVAPSSEGDPSDLALSVLGRIAAMLGFNAIGEIALAEEVEHLPSQDGTATIIPFVPSVPSTIDAGAFADLDAGMARIHAPTSDTEKSLVVALRWYEKGMRASSPADKLLSFFVGIEAVITAHANEYGPLPVQRERKERRKKLLPILKPHVDGETYQWFSNAAVSVSLKDRLRVYVAHRGLGNGRVELFDRLGEARNKLVHGSSSSATSALAAEARLLLEEVIVAELKAVL